MSKLHPKLTFQLYTDEKCVGPGVIILLEKVRELGSLRKASLSIDMAYSKAFNIIKRAEKELDTTLLVSKTGGAFGGGAILSDDALRLIKEYRDCECELNDFCKQKFDEHFSWL